MVQKIIDVVGVSPESFTSAATDAVRTAAMSVRNMKWARITDLEMGLEENKITEFRTTLRIYFDVETP